MAKAIHNGVSSELLSDAVWRKSSYSGAMGNCVEVARLASGDIAVRNSRIRRGLPSSTPKPRSRRSSREPRTVSSMTSPSEVVDANASTEEAAEETEKARVEDVLGRLIERGYKFVHPRDAAGEIVAVVGVRVHGNVVDVVRLDAEDEVTAIRMPEGEQDVLSPTTVLWRKDGAMCEVVDALLELPDASESLQTPAVGRRRHRPGLLGA